MNPLPNSILQASGGTAKAHTAMTAATPDRFRDASLKGLEGTIRDMETTETQSDQTMKSTNRFVAGTKLESEKGKEIMNQLEGLEADILTSLQDISEPPSSERNMVAYDQVTSTASRSHDQATMSNDQTTTSHDQTTASQYRTTISHDQTTMSRDQTTTSRDQATTSRGQTTTSHDQTTASRDQKVHNSPPTSKAVTRGTQCPSTIDVTRSPSHDHAGASEEQQKRYVFIVEGKNHTLPNRRGQ